jgi:uncharacterized protein involved in exopolysaccharide biosynthesis
MTKSLQLLLIVILAILVIGASWWGINALSKANAFGEEFKKSAFLEIPLPEDHIESFLNGRALVIKSNNILAECVRDLQLNLRWKVSHAEAIKLLSQKVSATREPETDLLRIEVTSDTELEAQELLDGIITANISYFTGIESREKQLYLEKLNKELQDQGDLVQDYRKALMVLVQQYGAPYFENAGSSLGRTEMALFQKSQENLAELEQQQRLAQIQVRQLLNTADDDLIRLAAGMELPNNRISEYYKSYRTLNEKAEALVAGGLAPDHPNIKTLKQQMERSLSNAGKEVVSLKEILQTQLSLIDKKVEATKTEMRARKDGCVDLSLRQHQYNTAVREYEAARGHYSKMSQQQEELRVEIKMPSAPFYIQKIP